MPFVMFHQVLLQPLDLAVHQPAALTALVDCFVVLCALMLSTRRY